MSASTLTEVGAGADASAHGNAYAGAGVQADVDTNVEGELDESLRDRAALEAARRSLPTESILELHDTACSRLGIVSAVLGATSRAAAQGRSAASVALADDAPPGDGASASAAETTAAGPPCCVRERVRLPRSATMLMFDMFPPPSVRDGERLLGGRKVVHEQWTREGERFFAACCLTVQRQLSHQRFLARRASPSSDAAGDRAALAPQSDGSVRVKFTPALRDALERDCSAHEAVTRLLYAQWMSPTGTSDSGVSALLGPVRSAAERDAVARSAAAMESRVQSACAEEIEGALRVQARALRGLKPMPAQRQPAHLYERRIFGRPIVFPCETFDSSGTMSVVLKAAADTASAEQVVEDNVAAAIHRVTSGHWKTPHSAAALLSLGGVDAALDSTLDGGRTGESAALRGGHGGVASGGSASGSASGSTAAAVRAAALGDASLQENLHAAMLLHGSVSASAQACNEHDTHAPKRRGARSSAGGLANDVDEFASGDDDDMAALDARAELERARADLREDLHDGLAIARASKRRREPLSPRAETTRRKRSRPHSSDADADSDVDCEAVAEVRAAAGAAAGAPVPESAVSTAVRLGVARGLQALRAAAASAGPSWTTFAPSRP